MARIISYPEATPTTSDLLVGTQVTSGGENVTKNFSVGDVVALGDGSLVGYTVYTALITQSGVSDPTVTELKNNTGATYTWSRTGPGEYEIQASANVFDATDTLVFGNIGENAKPDYFRWRVANVNLIEVTTYDENAVLTDGVLQGGSFEIRIYS